MLKLIVCVSENDAIGKNNDLLFHLKEDMKNFRRLTTEGKANVVIMGYNTYKSLNTTNGLPKRLNVVLTRNKERIEELNKLENVTTFDSLQKVASSFNDKDDNVYIIGGASVYKQALDNDYVDEICLTRVKKRVKDADAFFPRLDYYKTWEIYKVDSFEEGILGYDIAYIRKRC